MPTITNTTDATKPRSRYPRWIPNALSAIRLGIGLLFPFLDPGTRVTAPVIALATEFLDGQIARLLRVPSSTGQILDPIADKIFVLFVLGTLTWERTLAPWQLALVIARDLMVTAGSVWVASQHGLTGVKRLTPSLLGKSATAAQCVFLLMTVAYAHVSPILLGLTAVLSLAAGFGYLIRFR